MSDALAHYNYPIALDRSGIEGLIPHRGAIFACERLLIESHSQFSGVARWPLNHSIIEGHFPGMSVVPGVLLIEAMAQLAGAGLLRGDPYTTTLPQDSIGVLASVRNCWFKSPVLPDSDVEFQIQCRQLSSLAVQISARVEVTAVEVASLSAVIAYVPRDQMLAALSVG
jgi:3-hydroxyacyl-[acyl-carrier-protein] dehydratase